VAKVALQAASESVSSGWTPEKDFRPADEG
jgi:hypothetical protein